jgi:hypothetical protein
MAGGGWRTGREWGDLDIAILTALARLDYTMDRAARLLNRSRNSVAGAARRCGIVFPRYKSDRTYPHRRSNRRRRHDR